jgi:hypothetical protein
MADIAVIFHWPPQEMDSFTLSELMAWRKALGAILPVSCSIIGVTHAGNSRHNFPRYPRHWLARSTANAGLAALFVIAHVAYARRQRRHYPTDAEQYRRSVSKNASPWNTGVTP